MFPVCSQPEKAFEVYELGMKKNPKSAALASKTGKALIKSHYYFKVHVVYFLDKINYTDSEKNETMLTCIDVTQAINYYEAALKTEQLHFLRYDLAELLMKMKQFERCERVLHEALDHEAGTEVVT